MSLGTQRGWRLWRAASAASRLPSLSWKLLAASRRVWLLRWRRPGCRAAAAARSQAAIQSSSAAIHASVVRSPLTA